jgi:hypothetical protein
MARCLGSYQAEGDEDRDNIIKRYWMRLLDDGRGSKESKSRIRGIDSAHLVFVRQKPDESTQAGVMGTQDNRGRVAKPVGLYL